MGVTGLWRLIEPSGKPVPLETLENKVLAIDVSIWLHQAIKGFQDAQGAPLPNAHLLGIYHRVCKLLYFRIKPVFVFDGGVPNLKKETISKRNQQKSKKLNEAERIQKQLLTTLLKHSAVSKVLSEKAKASLAVKVVPSKTSNKEKSENIYQLPPTEIDSTLSSSEDESTSTSMDSSPTKHWDLHTIDEKSPHFKSLPADVRHEILTDLKETRKQSSWGKIHQMPKQSDDFSSFQMKRLLKRYSVQISLEEAEKEMGGRSLSLAELETLLKEQGVVTSTNSAVGIIASDENTKYLLIKDVKKAMDDAKKQKELSDALYDIQETEEKEQEKDDTDSKHADDESVQHQIASVDTSESAEHAVKTDDIQEHPENHDTEFQRDLEKAIQLSLHDVPSTSQENNQRIGIPSTSKQNFSFLEGFTDADFHSTSESEEDICHQKPNSKLSSMKSYMMEYSGLTPAEIAKIMGNNADLATKNKIRVGSKTDTIRGKNEKPLISANKNIIEESEDTTVSSSTNTATLENVIINNSADCNVSSSTNRHDVPETLSHSETPEDNKDDIETVEIMSDDASSVASNDFLEVSEKKDIKEGFAIFIKPEDSLEDDIFSDIFSGKQEESKIESDNNTSNLNIEIEPEAAIDNSSKEKLVTEAEPEDLRISNNVDVNTKKKVKFDENVVENKEEQTKNVISDLIKPLQEKSNSSDKSKSETQSEAENKILTTEELEVIEENLRQEKEELISEKLSKERMASNLTDQIYQEAQELLQLFGVPFIVAPMEAEAQCAFLDNVNLTDGTITDDSDIWLFGGKTVYKNFFNQHKHVMEFRAENVQHNFKLTREQMILLALLVGSDYTVGIQGIGPVTALEILAAFPPSKLTQINLTNQQIVSGLEEFRKWLIGEKAVGPGRTTLRNKLKNVTLIDSFPSLQVVQAYLDPTVDSSKEPFSWAKPDIAGLLQFARQKFGWTRVKSEEILKPVLKRLNETRIQRSMKDYFQTKHKIDSGNAENKMSKRVKKAVTRMGREPDEDSEEEKKIKKPNRKQNQKSKKAVKSNKDAEEATADVNEPTEGCAEGFSSDEDIQILKRTRTQSKKKLQQITTEVKKEIEQQVAKKPRTIASLHKKEVIPQKEKNKVDALRSKIKAIEVFRKSKKGPGYLQKRKKITRNPKEDAELSESSSD